MNFDRTELRDEIERVEGQIQDHRSELEGGVAESRAGSTGSRIHCPESEPARRVLPPVGEFRLGDRLVRQVGETPPKTILSVPAIRGPVSRPVTLGERATNPAKRAEQGTPFRGR